MYSSTLTNSVNSVDSVNSVSSYSAVLPLSLMVFLCVCSFYVFNFVFFPSVFMLFISCSVYMCLAPSERKSCVLWSCQTSVIFQQSSNISRTAGWLCLPSFSLGHISIWLVNIIWNGFVKLRIQQTSHISRTVGHIRAALSSRDPPQYTGQTSLCHSW